MNEDALLFLGFWTLLAIALGLLIGLLHLWLDPTMWARRRARRQDHKRWLRRQQDR